MRLPRVNLIWLLLGFVALMVALFGLLVLLVGSRLEQVNREVSEQRLHIEQMELRQAVAGVIAKTEQAARRLADWDETRQQLANPTYYVYWQSSRALANPNAAGFLDEIELYRADGRPLRNPPSAHMPTRFETLERFPYVVTDQGQASLWVAAAVRNPGDDQAVGHIVVRSDFLASLRELEELHHVEIGTLQFRSATGMRLVADQIAGQLSYRRRQDDLAFRLNNSVKRSVFEAALIALVLALVFYVALRFYLIGPARNLMALVDDLRRGNRSEARLHAAEELPVIELDQIRRSLTGYQLRLNEVHGRLDEKNRELWDLAHRDALTGIGNRRGFEVEWEQCLLSKQGCGSRIVMLLFDCDHFKAINDSYGHEVGDRLLIAIAATLEDRVPEGGAVYRLGGDEFAMLVYDMSMSAVWQLAEQCLDAIHQVDIQTLGIREPIRLSVGIAEADCADRERIDALRRQADLAMYRAKRPGSSPISVFQPEMAESGEEDLVSSLVRSLLYQALNDPNGLIIEFEPIARIADKDVAMVETLTRLRDHGERIYPGRFLPVVEARRLEAEFDLAVLARLMAELRERSLPEGMGVTVNLFGPSLSNASVVARLRELGELLDGRQKVIEVTETALITQLGHVTQVLEGLRQRGFLVALDDFGTGYSSLRYLTDMPVDIIKFDSDLVATLRSKGREGGVARGLARLLKDNGYRLVAEGVDGAADLTELAELGFDFVQGRKLLPDGWLTER